MSPDVSVILPVYNAAATLEQAVQSVRDQGHPSLEIVIVDDGSTDDSPAVIERLAAPDVRCFRQENAGPSAARNVAIRECQAPVIAMIDADDLWPEGKLALQLERLREDPELMVVSGLIERVPLDGNSLDPALYGDGLRTSSVNLGAALFRREVFDSVGLLDESMRFSEDQDWFLRAREQGVKMLFLQEVTLIYRRHEGNMTARRSARQLMIPAALKKSLERRRKMAERAQNLPGWSELEEKSG